MVKIKGLGPAALARARRRGKISLENAAKSVSYRLRSDIIRVVLRNGTEVLIPRSKIDGLRGLPKSAATELEVDFGGEALSIEARDVHISVGGLIRKAILGDDPYARAGRSRSPGKARAARVNGLRGGRPRRAA